MKKTLFAMLAAAAFAMPTAQAQSGATPADVKLAAASPLALAAPVDPAAAAAVKELLIAMKYREMMQDSFAQLQKNMPAIMLQGATSAIQSNYALTEEEVKAALERAQKEIPAAAVAFNASFDDPGLMDELIAEIIPLYARHFTAAEIKQLAAFYKTPVGVKMISTMPKVMNESMQIGQKVMMPRIAAAIAKLAPQKKAAKQPAPAPAKQPAK